MPLRIRVIVLALVASSCTDAFRPDIDSPSSGASSTPAATGTPTAPAGTPTASPTATPVATSTPEPTPSPSPSPTPAPTPSPTPIPAVTFVGAGDIAGCNNDNDEITATLLDGIPGTVFNLGDNAYDRGTLEEHENCYGPTWGRHKARTRGVVAGNHEYGTPGAAGHFTYWGTAAGEPGKGWYSFDLGSWHVIVLNSNCWQRGVGGCEPGSEQEQWLRADLAANAKPCTIALWHHARFSSSQHGNDRMTGPFWQALYEADADVILSAHDHAYERFAPQTPDAVADPVRGIRQFLVGTGGRSRYGFPQIQPNSEARDNSYGVLKLTLRDGAYDWEFVGEPGSTFTDSGTGLCH